MPESEDREWMDAPMGPITDAVPSLEEVKDSLPAELTAQRKALEAHIQAWFLERQEANSRAIDLEAENARLQERVEELDVLGHKWKQAFDDATAVIPATLNVGNKKMMAQAIIKEQLLRVRELERERDRDQAQAERHGEALNRIRSARKVTQSGYGKKKSRQMRRYEMMQEAAAALAPEEEGQ